MTVGELEERDESSSLPQLPPQTTCAKCEREITCEEQDSSGKYRYSVIEVRDLLADATCYYHHSCYNQQFQTKGR